MSFINSLTVMGAKWVMGALALNVGLAMAFVFPMVTFVIAALLAGIVAKRAKSSDALNAAYPTTGAMGLLDD
jgi:uncharacterized protein involved in cysteine biosynthesis